ncbi:MAG: tRNA pseudouridine(55) synthase TruB [Lachnospiraceae bacterium]|nr:tRNA pseudouridine(55) synthase TruB [Clostridiaceae bacterium]MDY3825553.1 tRNA pseudouridine(55) synthase TruB [Lachnospiraceae bacterium]QUO22022.1 tRNA pseudouridine(55) synthase TruB [Clostridiaceae bacterium Marseille-Q4143]
MINGVINIYKERGFTSHDVVAKLRGILKQKKIGHTGTLDPDAEGVLPVCLGKGTRLCDMLTDHSKVYEAVLLLGQSTDTQDVSGNVLQEAPVDVSEEEVREAIMSFVGPYDQIPPMYSALKVNGQKLCDLARAGKEVERKARPVEIYEIQIEEIHLPRVRMTVSCSKGTYIRTLCHDIGEKLKCHGCMESLLRTRVGQFLLKDSLTLAQVEAYRDENRITEIVMPVDQVFSDCPALKLTKEAAKLGYNGNPFTSTQALTENDQMVEKSSDISLDGGKWFRVYDPEGVFIGVYAYDSKRDQFRPEKMFYEK